MKKSRLIVIGLFMSVTTALADSGTAYLNKFLAYMSWSDSLPKVPPPEFITFINTPSPLTIKLRNKWLHELAKTKDWNTFAAYYRPSDSTTLQCEYSTALLNQGKKQEALILAQQLWLHGHGQPKACDVPFKQLLVTSPSADKLIQERVILALKKRNISLAFFLLKNPNYSNANDLKTLRAIHRKPARILTLSPSTLNRSFYLYGLVRLIPGHIEQAEKLWNNPKTANMLTEQQKQTFLARFALYKAIKKHPDAPSWFNKVDAKFYDDALLTWQVRHALAQTDWKKVKQLTSTMPDNTDPCWQYWSARASEALGEPKKAQKQYEQLAKKRHYYGFLASVRINKPFSFENELPVKDMHVLAVYTPILDQIKSLYRDKKKLKASTLLNDFASELTKDEKSALAYWVANDLHWHSKSIYLGNDDELQNQLALRFPIAYKNSIMAHGRHYNISSILIYAMIRQESAFREDSISAAGANGLMQVMPMTAKQIAKREKIPYQNTKQLFYHDKNINLGVAYLHYLANRFHHHPLLMAAAYNAGPRQVERWLKSDHPEEMDIWIETLPWQETRNYLKNVISFYAVYQHRLKQESTIKRFLSKL